jgi:glutamine amidotransferase
MIGIINYGMGNLRSVQKAFEKNGAEAQILSSAAQVMEVQRLVLPGVGAFADGMANLRAGGWVDPIHAFIRSGRPFLGICLGMQLLFEGSEEDAPSPQDPVRGLAVVPGQVRRFRGDAFGPGRLKVPHMGWNHLTCRQDVGLFEGLPRDPAVYFVHSYYAVPADDRIIAATADYGGAFCAAVAFDNVCATQFHPEKSQLIGLRMLSNFAAR